MQLNKMTKSILTLALAGCLALGAFAEPRRDRGDWGQKMQQKLNLTAAQQEQLKPIFQAQREQHKKWREQSRTQMMGILTAEQRAQLEAARGQKGQRGQVWKSLNLTPEQKAQMKELRQRNKPQMQASRQQFQSQVAAVLTAEQKARWEEMKSQHRGFKGKKRRGQPQS